MTSAISIRDLSKAYKGGHQALSCINLDIKQGEILALLGPNGAGKTTLISTVCGIVNPSHGHVSVYGHDHIKAYRQARSHIGLVPQELTTDAFETVWNTVSLSRGLFGKPKNPEYIESILKRLSLWDKKDTQIRRLSGGMKRRVMIAKALSHEPDILFLDEPSAGVDVELRKSMWQQVRELRDAGVTVILTTHYIEEAEEMADRIGVINKGEIIIVEEKEKLMKSLGQKEMFLELDKPIKSIPKILKKYKLELLEKGSKIKFLYDPAQEKGVVSNLLDSLKENGLNCVDIHTHQSSLEDIFVQLVEGK